MYTVTAIFRLAAHDITFVEIGGTDLDTDSPTWFAPHPIAGPNTTDDWEALARPLVARFAAQFGAINLHGGRLAFTSPMVAVMEFDFDFPERDDRDDERLGSCGCTDYHMADCPIRTGSFYEPFDFYPEQDDH